MDSTVERSREQTMFSILIAISFAHLLNDMMQSVIPSIYPLLKEKYGFSFGQIGVITLVYQMTASILQPFVGRYADRHPMPFSLSIGMMFTFAGMVIVSFANTFLLILLSVSIIGWGSSIFHPEASRIAQMAAGGKKGLAQSIFQVGGNGGSAIGPLLAALIVIPFGQGSISVFAIAALVAAATLYWVGLWYRERIHTAAKVLKQTGEAVVKLSERKIKRVFHNDC